MSPTPTATPFPPPETVVDHFLCYRARVLKGLDKFTKQEVQLSNQFGDRTVDLLRVSRFCNAVDKNGEGILDDSAHLTCYESRPGPPNKEQVITTDQFGDHELDVLKRRTSLCVPSAEISMATPTPTSLPMTAAVALPASVDHFELYKARRTPRTPRFEKTLVDLVDPTVAPGEEFLVQLTRPVQLGVPTDKNGEGINHPQAHLTCYAMFAPAFRIQNVDVTNQFGDFRLKLRRPDLLCVPSDKTLVDGDV